jgi:hypothetical protein
MAALASGPKLGQCGLVMYRVPVALGISFEVFIGRIFRVECALDRLDS